MSFFRVLFALLISAGIALGLYAAVDGRGLERAVEAVRTEIAARTGTGDGAQETEEPIVMERAGTEDAAQGDPVAAVETASVDGADTAAEDGTQEPEEPVVMERVETEDAAKSDPVAAAADASGTTETASGDGAGAPVETGTTETETTSFAARIEQETAEAVEDDATSAETASRDGAETAAEPGANDLPRIAAMPAPPETVLPDDAQAPAALEAQEPLPAARLAAASGTAASDTGGTSTAALDIVKGGMNYIEARETLIGAGWSPRLPATRSAGPNAAENTMIEAGYGELEGCNDSERPICRFEFVDGEKRIAAVLTAGGGTDPSVIDAFLMTIRAE